MHLKRSRPFGHDRVRTSWIPHQESPSGSQPRRRAKDACPRSPSDPSRPITTFKTAWKNVRAKAKVTGRWHDNRHTLITDLAESGAGDQTIMDIAGHVSKRMLKHYSHIRMEAKRRALESIVNKTEAGKNEEPARESGKAETKTSVGYL